MTDQLISDGTYRVRGPGGQLTMESESSGVTVMRPEYESTQEWKVAAASGGVTVRSVASDQYLGTDESGPQMRVQGTSKPFVWSLSAGDDGDERTYVLTAAGSSEELVLTTSLLRIWPPQVALLSPSDFSIVEWAFDPVE